MFPLQMVRVLGGKTAAAAICASTRTAAAGGHHHKRRLLQQQLHTSGQLRRELHQEDADSLRRKPTQSRSFPSFSINGSKDVKDLVRRPKPIVVLDIFLSGTAHTMELNPRYAAVAGSGSSLEVYEGAKLAASMVSKAIAEADKEVLQGVMTPQAAAAANRTLAANPNLQGTDSDLVSMPKEDVLLSWIHTLDVSPSGECRALLVTISFPAFGFMTRKIQENKLKRRVFLEESEKKFQGARLSTVRQTHDMDQFKEDWAKAWEETVFDPNPYFRYNPLVVSNFELVRKTVGDDGGEGQWLVDGVSMGDARDVRMSALAMFKWKGRMSFALRYGNMMQMIRLDYVTDFLIVCGFLAVFIGAPF